MSKECDVGLGLYAVDKIIDFEKTKEDFQMNMDDKFRCD